MHNNLSYLLTVHLLSEEWGQIWLCFSGLLFCQLQDEGTSPQRGRCEKMCKNKWKCNKRQTSNQNDDHLPGEFSSSHIKLTITKPKIENKLSATVLKYEWVSLPMPQFTVNSEPQGGLQELPCRYVALRGPHPLSGASCAHQHHLFLPTTEPGPDVLTWRQGAMLPLSAYWVQLEASCDCVR